MNFGSVEALNFTAFAIADSFFFVMLGSFVFEPIYVNIMVLKFPIPNKLKIP
jgi:hypothetical protein